MGLPGEAFRNAKQCTAWRSGNYSPTRNGHDASLEGSVHWRYQQGE